MNEALTSTPNTTTISDKDMATIEYFKKLDGKRTARHASEEGLNSPLKSEVVEATKLIRGDITGVFKGDESLDTFEHQPIAEVKDAYWERASRVGAEHGARPEYTKLEQYFQADPSRNYEDIKSSIENDFSEDSVTRSVLDGIDAYQKVLDVNPATAATIVTELIGHRMPDIQSGIDRAMGEGELSREDATRTAFEQFINSEVPYHINQIIDNHGYGDDAVRAFINKPSFYPNVDNEGNSDTALSLSTSDIKGLIRVYDIQSRPYSEKELTVGGEIAAMPEMQGAMLHVHEQLVAFSEQYLKEHPDRAEGDMRNFSEIFVKEGNDDAMELLPNPKLLRAMVNNVMPAVAKSIIERDAAVTEVTSDDIVAGIRIAAKEYKLFQTNIGQFKNYNKTTNSAELHSMYKVVCPANALFPSFLTAKLADFYQQEKESPAPAS